MEPNKSSLSQHKKLELATRLGNSPATSPKTTGNQDHALNGIGPLGEAIGVFGRFECSSSFKVLFSYVFRRESF